MSNKYTTLEIIVMMLDWKSWMINRSVRGSRVFRNGVIELWGNATVAFDHDRSQVTEVWTPNVLTWCITRPFWWYLKKKMGVLNQAA